MKISFVIPCCRSEKTIEGVVARSRRPWLAPAFRGIALLGGFNQLKSQTTREGYDKTYAGMLELNDIFVFTDEKGKKSDRPTEVLSRLNRFHNCS